MKFIHIADVHWGARPEREQTFGMIREQEIKETFQRVIDHANKQQVDLLLIAGDLFDQPPTQQELSVAFWEFFERNQPHDRNLSVTPGASAGRRCSGPPDPDAPAAA